jgi:AmmeMemoRadiSam system protein A
MAVRVNKYSHQDVTGVGYGICSFYPDGDDEARHFLDKKKMEALRMREGSDGYVKLAWASLESYVRSRKKLKVRDIPAELSENLPDEIFSKKAGAFVSIHKNGELRGCIGTIAPTTESIAQEIVNNAISASTRDPRFEPITEEELKWLEINVDVLGEPEDIDSMDQLDVKRYGVIVSCGTRRGLLLPDIDGIDDVETQVSIAMRKGDIKPTEDYTLQRFEVIRHK